MTMHEIRMFNRVGNAPRVLHGNSLHVADYQKATNRVVPQV